MSGFDLDKMFFASKEAIENFAKEHTEETFFAFSIDAGMLCLNSKACFKHTLRLYQKEFPDSYTDSHSIDELKYNTGDWEYQGFFDLNEGFDHDLYAEHYDIPFDNKGLAQNKLDELFQNTDYHKVMSELLARLEKSGCFNLLKKTSNFRIFLSEHEY